MKRIYTLIVLALVTTINANLFAQIDTYTVSEAYQLTLQSEEEPNFVILDVRTAGEYNPQHLEGAINRDFYDDNFEQMLLDLDMSKTYLIHCQSGYRSSLTYAMMQDMDFVSFYDMLGGIAAWNSASYPTTTDFAPHFLSYNDMDLEFGSILLGDDNTMEITVTNANNSTLEFTSISSLGGTEFTSDFDVTTLLEGADNYTFQIVFTPITDDVQSNATFTIESNGGTIEYILQGNGVNVVNVGEFNENDFQVFPNPANERLFIAGNIMEELIAVQLYNNEGRLVLSQNDFEFKSIDVQGLESGSYIVHFILQDSSFSKKIVLVK